MRDYQAEMTAWIAQAMTRLPPNAAIMAHQLVNELRRSDPDLLDGWLRLDAEEAVKRAIRAHLSGHNRRGNAPGMRPAYGTQPFRRATQALAAGDPTPMQEILTRTYLVDGVARPLAQLNGPQLTNVADTFARSAEEHLMHEAFLRELARKCTQSECSVGDLYDEQTIATIWDSMRLNR